MESFSPTTQFLIDIAKEAEKILLRHYSPLGVTATLKSDMSPVTIADTEVNSMIIKNVKERYPDFGVIGEEESLPSQGKKFFVVDPLDGTHMFTIGAPMFCFSAAVVIDGVSMAGIIGNPLAKRTLVAEKGKGAYLVETGTQIKVSDLNKLKGSIINAGYNDTREVAGLHALGANTMHVYAVCEAASLVALGGFVGNIFTGRKPWDTAATKILIEEAGGKVTDLNGNDQRYDQETKGALMSNGKLHDQLLKIIKESGIAEEFK